MFSHAASAHTVKWEDRGWIDVANSGLIRDVLARLRARSAITTFRWVKGHSGVLGNEMADRLAADGAQRPANEARRLPPPPLEFVSSGVKLSALTQRLAYRGIRYREKPLTRKATTLRMSMVQDAARVWQQNLTEATLWRAVRQPDVRRSLRDFWWKALHDALRIGRYWAHIPMYEERENCALCGEEESLEHILLECRCNAVRVVWALVDALFRKAGVTLPPRTLGALLAAPAFDMKALTDKPVPGSTRLSVHLLWVLRCARVIDPDFPEGVTDYADTAIVARWMSNMNRRLAIDQRLVHKRLGKAALDRTLVLNTWDRVLHDRLKLPDDWILKPGVLVGNLTCSTRENG
ncbi:hypothetical protein C2E23DRAFT_871116 [Lenzites betulinus]|nr:hypothetical protein C2E23DRAFT_871116 [Lenzites betulinus]